MWRKVALSGQGSVKLHKILILIHEVAFVFCRFFNKDLAIYCSPVTLYPIEVVLMMAFFSCLIYSYKNRFQEIKQHDKWLIDHSHHHQHPLSAPAAADLDSWIGFFLKNL